LDVDVGKVIAGKYELVRLIGQGAMAEVWLARHRSLGGEFAIKLIEPTGEDEAESAAARFQLEAQIAATLSRKTRHIVSVSDHGEDDGLAYLVMEHLEGESLEARLERGPSSMAEAALIVSQIARALTLAHGEGILHRDLKPANVWLGRDEDGRLLVKLLDFGIARTLKPLRARSPLSTGEELVLGTPAYMSPEQVRGLPTLDHRCDVWALAAVAYEALAAKAPFDGVTVEDVFLSICTFRAVPIRSRDPALTPAVDALFARAFAPEIDERFQSASELAIALERLSSPEELDEALGFAPAPSSRRAHASTPPSASRIALSAELFTPPGGTVLGERPAASRSGHRVRSALGVAAAAAVVAAIAFGSQRIGAHPPRAVMLAGVPVDGSSAPPPTPVAPSAIAPPTPVAPSTSVRPLASRPPPTPAIARPAPLPSRARLVAKPVGSGRSDAAGSAPAASSPAILEPEPVDKSEIF
jgi:serine/threonine-protein kinase